MHKKILMGIVIIATVMSLVVVADRYKAEERNSNIEIAVDMSDYRDLAGAMGIDFRDMAKKLQAHGVTTLAIQEATLKDLRDRGLIAYMPLGDVISNIYSNGMASLPVAQQIKYLYKAKQGSQEVYNSTVIITQNKDVYTFLEHALAERTIIETLQKDNSYAVIVKQKITDFDKRGLGL